MENRQRGKRCERAVAEIMGGKRVGIMGGEDVEHGLLSIEVKSRERFVADKWMSQAIANCPDGKIPSVVVHIHGRRHKDNFIMLRLGDWIDLYGELPKTSPMPA